MASASKVSYSEDADKREWQFFNSEEQKEESQEAFPPGQHPAFRRDADATAELQSRELSQ